MKSPNMWLTKLRRPNVLVGILFVSLLVCLAMMAQYWTNGYSETMAYNKHQLKEMSEQTKESNQPTLDTTSVPTTEQKMSEPEKGLYNFTVVTALLDIGRGSWSHQNRTFDQYVSYMEQVMRLEVNMVIYIDPKGVSAVERMRRGKEKHTRIINSTLVNLPYYRYRARMAEIMASEEYKKDNQLVAINTCESYIPEYIMQLSKLYFMNRTIWENPFSTSYFMWMDAGYAHGHDVFPQNNIWIPKGLFEFPDKVTFMDRPPGVKHFEKDKDRLHKLNINILAGNFFAGGAKAMKELCEIQRVVVDEWMEKGIVDDDQSGYMYVYYRKPSLFHLVVADWYDVFKVFNINTDHIKSK